MMTYLGGGGGSGSGGRLLAVDSKVKFFGINTENFV